MVNNLFYGAGYFFRGAALIKRPGIRLYVIVPFLINLLVLLGLISFIFYQFDGWISLLTGWLPEFLQWLNYVLWLVLVIAIVLGFGTLFTLLANIVAAPFNGILSQKVEIYLQPDSHFPDDLSGLSGFIQESAHSFAREWQKLVYYLPKALALVILTFIPGINLITPFAWFLFSAWMMSIQYCDYPMGNHRVSFGQMKQIMAQYRSLSMGFGVIVSVMLFVPLLNLIIMPIAVSGATLMWVETFKGSFKTH